MNFKQMGNQKTAKEEVLIKSLDKKHTKNTEIKVGNGALMISSCDSKPPAASFSKLTHCSLCLLHCLHTCFSLSNEFFALYS